MNDIINTLVQNGYDLLINDGEVFANDPVFTITDKGLTFSHYNEVKISNLLQAVNFVSERE